MTSLTVALIALAAIGVVAIALLGAMVFLQSAQIRKLTIEHAQLKELCVELGEKNQQELLAIGQRVLEADKIVRRFSERLDGIENNPSTEQPQYGQLRELLAKAMMQDDEASSAEVELLSLLRRQQRG